MKKSIFGFDIKPIDLIPALSGLVGKIALASSFALVWAKEIGITDKSFVFENVRIEILIGSIITLLAAIAIPGASPPGTLAPLVVLIPVMAAFGVHPFILGIIVSVIGIIAVKTGIFNKLVVLSGFLSKASLTLCFGISGIILSVKNLYKYFEGNRNSFLALLTILSFVYIVLFIKKKLWFTIPASALVAILVPYLFGYTVAITGQNAPINLNPAYWWNNVWGIGFGFDLVTILKTIPFALFVVLLWTIDTVSIKTIQDASYEGQEGKEKIHLEYSFLIVSARNLLGALFGGAQTSSLWRSFLIPLFMVKRPMKNCAILLGVIGIGASITAVPIQVLSYTPLVWSVLLFGIFMPFTVTAGTNIIKVKSTQSKVIATLLSLLGVLVNPILTWIVSIAYERLIGINRRTRLGEK
jgi:hypothetical protein